MKGRVEPAHFYQAIRWTGWGVVNQKLVLPKLQYIYLVLVILHFRLYLVCRNQIDSIISHVKSLNFIKNLHKSNSMPLRYYETILLHVEPKLNNLERRHSQGELTFEGQVAPQVHFQPTSHTHYSRMRYSAARYPPTRATRSLCHPARQLFVRSVYDKRFQKRP